MRLVVPSRPANFFNSALDFCLQLAKVCPWRRYKSASQMNAGQRRGNTKKADWKHVSIRVNKDQA